MIFFLFFIQPRVQVSCINVIGASVAAAFSNNAARRDAIKRESNATSTRATVGEGSIPAVQFKKSETLREGCAHLYFIYERNYSGRDYRPPLGNLYDANERGSAMSRLVEQGVPGLQGIVIGL